MNHRAAVQALQGMTFSITIYTMDAAYSLFILTETGCQSPELNDFHKGMYVKVSIESNSGSLNDNLVSSKLWVLVTAELFNIDVVMKERC